jgi:hypothetical protein
MDPYSNAVGRSGDAAYRRRAPATWISDVLRATVGP